MTVSYDFSDTVVAVTGGANGIGRAIADAFMAAGATVEAWDVAMPRGGAPIHGTLGWSHVDVTRADTIKSATDALVARHGRIDVLVNNAGYLGPSMALDAYDPMEWRRLIEVNLIGVYEVARHVVPVMRRQKSGRIINIASIAGKEGTANATAYSAAKAGVIGLTKALAKEVVADGIFVNALAPGPIETELLKQATPEHIQVMLSKCPMGRLAQPNEAAAMVLWLASEDASFNTGAIFDLSGGRAVY